MTENPFSLKDKNIIITGASSGIGQKCAIICSQMGANVVLIGRSEKKLEITYRLLSPGNNLIYPFDITHFTSIEGIIKDSILKIGLINGFLHSAGIEFLLPNQMTKSEHYDALFKTNVIAAFEFAKILSKKKYHVPEKLSLVFISSVMGFLGEIGHSAYCSSKGAIIAGSKALALELADKKIRVNTISPAVIFDTPMSNNMFLNFTEENKALTLENHPLGYGKTEDVAYGAVYLLSDAARWITGTNLIVDGGYSAR